MSRFSRWNLLILVLYYTTIVASSRYGGSLRSTVVDETLEDKEIFRGLLNNFYSDEHDGRDENQLLNDEKIRREEEEEAEQEAEVDQIYREAMKTKKEKIKEKTKELGGADNEHLEKKIFEEKRKQKRAAKVAAWEKEQESKSKSSST